MAGRGDGGGGLLLVGMGDGGADGIRIPLRLTSDVQAAGPRSPKIQTDLFHTTTTSTRVARETVTYYS